MDNTIKPDTEYDVVIVGAGPAGCMASLCFTTYGFKVLHIDLRPETTQAGRADGLQARTLEVIRNIGAVPADERSSGLAERLLSQGVKIQCAAFWDPTEEKKLARTSQTIACPDFIDVVDNYTLLLHQGLIERAFLAEIDARRPHLPREKQTAAPPGGVFRPYEFLACSTDETNVDVPVTAQIKNVSTGGILSVKCKYLIGVDGANSAVRRAISGGEPTDGFSTGKIQMLGDATDIVWGVWDGELTTDFPDIRKKCLIHSKSDGSVMVIPREAGPDGTPLVRLYVQLQQDLVDPNGGLKHYERDATEDICKERARRILDPYTLKFGQTSWFSVYRIGQRIASSYTLDQRVFLGGDATHTHSPKAGQGMNVSMLDMHNLAWKINLVEKGVGNRSVLLPTYEEERRSVAEALVAFDKEYAAIFSGRSPKPAQMGQVVANDSPAVDAQLFIQTYMRNAFFASGCGVVYAPNILVRRPAPGAALSNRTTTALVPGHRLIPGRLSRAIDGNEVDVQQEVKMNGAFRVHVIAGDFVKSQSRLAALDKFLEAPTSFVNLYRPEKEVSSAIVFSRIETRHIEPEHRVRTAKRNPFFQFLYIFSSPYTEWNIEDLPYSARIYREHIYSDDLPDRRALQDAKATLHAKWGVSTDEGVIVVVRPDGYVGCVTSFDADGFETLNSYFAEFLRALD